MLDLLKSLWERAMTEGGVVSGAPMLFAGAVLFLVGLASAGIWQLMDWRYNGVIAGRDAIIGAKDSQIGLINSQLKDLSEQLSKVKINSAETSQDPDAVIQNGKIVGRTEGATPELGSGRYLFRSISTGEDFNPNFVFTYHGIRMRINNNPNSATSRSPQGMFRRFYDVECQIIDQH